MLGCAPDEDERTVRANIGPSGGQVSSHDGVLTVLILPGALESQREFVISPSDRPPAIYGPAYRVEPDVDLAVGAEITYARTLPRDYEGIAVAAIRREDFASGAGSWIKLPTIELDVANESVTGTDSEVSVFYGLIESSEPSGTTSTTTTDGSDETQGAETTSVDETDSGQTTGDPLSHASDIQQIWADNCLGQGCHSAGQTVPVLEGDGYGALVDLMPLAAAVPYVTPGDPQLSYLMHKLDGTFMLDANQGGCGCGGSGVPMPSGAPLLDESVRDQVRRWIEEGAEP